MRRNLPRGLQQTIIAVMSDKRENLRNLVFDKREIDEIMEIGFRFENNSMEIRPIVRW